MLVFIKKYRREIKLEDRVCLKTSIKTRMVLKNFLIDKFLINTSQGVYGPLKPGINLEFEMES